MMHLYNYNCYDSHHYKEEHPHYAPISCNLKSRMGIMEPKKNRGNKFLKNYLSADFLHKFTCFLDWKVDWIQFIHNSIHLLSLQYYENL